MLQKTLVLEQIKRGGQAILLDLGRCDGDERRRRWEANAKARPTAELLLWDPESETRYKTERLNLFPIGRAHDIALHVLLQLPLFYRDPSQREVLRPVLRVLSAAISAADEAKVPVNFSQLNHWLISEDSRWQLKQRLPADSWALQELERAEQLLENIVAQMPPEGPGGSSPDALARMGRTLAEHLMAYDRELGRWTTATSPTSSFHTILTDGNSLHIAMPMGGRDATAILATRMMVAALTQALRSRTLPTPSELSTKVQPLLVVATHGAVGCDTLAALLAAAKGAGVKMVCAIDCTLLRFTEDAQMWAELGDGCDKISFNLTKGSERMVDKTDKAARTAVAPLDVDELCVLPPFKALAAFQGASEPR